MKRAPHLPPRRLRPTARGWSVLGFSLVLSVIAALNGSPLTGFLACGGLALVAASLMTSLLAMLSGVRVTREVAGEAHVGGVLDLPLTVTNPIRRPRQTLVIIESIPFTHEPDLVTVVAPLKPGEVRVLKRRVLAMRRGEFTLSRLRVRSGDPAGLFCCEHRLDLPQTLVITPTIEPLSPALWKPSPAIAVTDGSSLSAAGLSQEFFGLREYQPRDGLRRVHWKSSARFRRLLVREFERNAMSCVAVALDTDEASVAGEEMDTNLEYQIRAAASLVYHVASLNCSLAICAGGAQRLIYPPSHAPAMRDKLLRHLAVLQPGKEPLAPVLLDLLELLPPQSILFCLGLSCPPPLRKALEIADARGVTVRCLVAPASAFHRSMWSRATKPVTEPLRTPFPVAMVQPETPLSSALAYAT